VGAKNLFNNILAAARRPVVATGCRPKSRLSPNFVGFEHSEATEAISRHLILLMYIVL